MNGSNHTIGAQAADETGRLPGRAASHVFDQALQLAPQADGSYLGQTSPDYWNFTGPFGGITAAVLMQSMLQHPDRLGQPVAMTVNYAAPVPEGTFRVHPRIMRSGRSTQHWSLQLGRDGDAPATTATAVFATRPQTWTHRPMQPPTMPPAETLPAFPTHLAASAWMRNYDLRFATGLPRIGSKPVAEPLEGLQHAWMSDRPARPLDYAALAALADCFFARVFVVRGVLMPVGTVSMTVYFHATEEDLAEQQAQPVFGVADSRIFDRGFHDQSAEIWSANGKLLVSTHQIVYFRDPPE